MKKLKYSTLHDYLANSINDKKAIHQLKGGIHFIAEDDIDGV